MSTNAPRTLADQLRSWPDDALASLLRARPDLGIPAPQDSSQLASRASSRASVTRALDGLTVLELGVLDAVIAAGGQATLEELQGVVRAAPDSVAAAARRVHDLALLWGPEHRLRVLSGVADVLGTSVSGLRTAERPIDLAPTLATSPRAQDLVDRAAAGAAFDAVRHVDLLLETWGTRPPGALRTGGLGVRDLKAVSVLLHVDERAAALVVETAMAAGLLDLGHTDALDAAWLPTESFDAWSAQAAEDKWFRLADAWLENQRLTGLVGGRDAGKVVNALAPDLERSWLATTRRESLQVLAELPPGEVLAAGSGLPSLVDRLRWLRPRRPATRGEAVAWCVEEATMLGVLALGGISTHGRALLADDPKHAAPLALRPLLPEPLDHVLVQADLTAVAPGPLEQQLAHDLALMADIESRGGATVYRFTDSSVRRAFDSGWSAQEVHAFLDQSSRTEVPQPLHYLVDDVSRRFGTVRVGTAESFLRSDDEAALSDLVHDRRASGLRLRRIAPTVVVSDVPIDVLLPRLRELGVAPVVEGPDGTVQVARRDTFRAKPKRGAPARLDHARDLARAAARVSAVVAAVRAGDHATEVRPLDAETRLRRTAPVSTLAVLREAAEHGGTVWIGYVDNDGSTMERVVDPQRVEGGWLTAYDHRTEGPRSFALHRVTAVRALDPS